jgi:release factor glutamine methyltransferase
MGEVMLAVDALRRACDYLESSYVESPRRTAEIILSELLTIKAHDIYLREGLLLENEKCRVYFDMVERRAKGEPLAYIVGNAEFMGLKFLIPKGVFIPRPETERLCEIVLGLLAGERSPRVADVCTGSGAIAVTLARMREDLTCCATDVSGEAVSCARDNAVRLGVSERISFYQCSLAQALMPLGLEGQLACVVANPPYVREGDLRSLPREIGHHEPLKALDGGADGTELYGPLFEQAWILVKDGGFVAVEVGDGADSEVSEMARSSGFTGVRAVRDLAGRARYVLGFK